MLKLLHYLLLLLPIAAFAEDASRLSVFVSIPPQKQFVEKVGGGHVDVQVMLPPGQSPETFAPSPRMLASLSSAQLYFQIGVPFEIAWTDAIKSANAAIRIAECCDRLVVTADGDDTHEHHDLHIWGSPAYVKILAGQIRDELSAVDPAHTDDYRSGHEKFIAELDALDADIRRRLAPRRMDQFIVSHAAWGYFAEQYGLVQLALENNGKESGPRSLLDIVRLAHEQNIRTVFAITQYRTPVIESLARELGAGIVELDPLAEDYLQNMVTVSTRIGEALR